MASAGNGGRANASADGGIVVIGKINSGGNRGNTINVGGIGGGATASARPVRSPSTVATSTTARTSTSTPAVARRSAMRQAAVATWPRLREMMAAAATEVAVRCATSSTAGTASAGAVMATRASAGNGGIADASADGGTRRHQRDQLGRQPGEYDRCRRHLRRPRLRSVPQAPAKPGKPAKAGKTIKAPTGKPARGVVAARCG